MLQISVKQNSRIEKENFLFVQMRMIFFVYKLKSKSKSSNLNLTDANGVAHHCNDTVILQFLESIFEVFSSDELRIREKLSVKVE